MAKQDVQSVLIHNCGEIITLAPLVSDKRLHSVTDQDLGRIENGFVYLEDGLIKEVGEGHPETIAEEEIDEVIEEPLGGAHRDVKAMSETLKQTISSAVNELDQMSIADRLEQRYARLMSYGEFNE